jgi:hypothetical protein
MSGLPLYTNYPIYCLGGTQNVVHANVQNAFIPTKEVFPHEFNSMSGCPISVPVSLQFYPHSTAPIIVVTADCSYHSNTTYSCLRSDTIIHPADELLYIQTKNIYEGHSISPEPN